MTSRTFGLATFAVAACLLTMPVTRAADSNGLQVARLARDVDKAEAIHAIKNLQNTFAQYAQFGLWDEMASLFADQGEAIYGAENVRGRTAVRGLLVDRFGGGTSGLKPGGLNTQLLMEPVVNVSPDGATARGRWRELSMLGRFGVSASWTGGLFQNDYVKQNGVWKVARLHYHPQYAGPYEGGWHNLTDDLPIVPTYYTPDQAGIPAPAAADDTGLTGVGDTAAQAAKRLTSLVARIDALNDEGRVLNLQNIYGYYVDRKMWDDVTDLFTADGVLELGDAGIYEGAKGIRRALEKDGPAGLKHGELNEHIPFTTTVTVLPGGQEAHTRGVDLGLLGDVDHDAKAAWSVTVFENRFVKENGVWKVREMRAFPLIKTDFYQGWAKSRLVDIAPDPDRPTPAADRTSGETMLIPAFFQSNPVTGNKIAAPAGMRIGGGNLLPAGRAPVASAEIGAAALQAALADARRKLAVAIGYDSVENLACALGNGIDDYQWESLGLLFAQKGMRQMPNSGFYTGPAKLTRAETERNGGPNSPRTTLGPHVMVQPVIDVAPDGRSAKYRVRLFQMSSSHTSVNRPGSVSGGMYPNNQAVLENGVWKIWSVAIDEFYWQGNLIDGWSRQGAGAGTGPRPDRPDSLKPDIHVNQLGKREETFGGGPGTVINWPDIKPMWFHYKNPVSGREPSHYWPDCATCVFAPNTSMKQNGY